MTADSLLSSRVDTEAVLVAAAAAMMMLRMMIMMISVVNIQ